MEQGRFVITAGVVGAWMDIVTWETGVSRFLSVPAAGRCCGSSRPFELLEKVRRRPHFSTLWPFLLREDLVPLGVFYFI